MASNQLYNQPDQLPDLDLVMTWITLHKWVMVIALVVGLLVRLMKSDSKIITLLPTPLQRWFAITWVRTWYALILSAVGGWAAIVLGGGDWRSALEQALVAFTLAVLGHQTIIEGMRSGKEIPVPGLTHSTTPLPLPPPTPTV